MSNKLAAALFLIEEVKRGTASGTRVLLSSVLEGVLTIRVEWESPKGTQFYESDFPLFDDPHRHPSRLGIFTSIVGAAMRDSGVKQ